MATPPRASRSSRKRNPFRRGEIDQIDLAFRHFYPRSPIVEPLEKIEQMGKDGFFHRVPGRKRGELSRLAFTGEGYLEWMRRMNGPPGIEHMNARRIAMYERKLVEWMQDEIMRTPLIKLKRRTRLAERSTIPYYEDPDFVWAGLKRYHQALENQLARYSRAQARHPRGSPDFQGNASRILRLENWLRVVGSAAEGVKKGRIEIPRKGIGF